ncbi:FecCD family ABC transporter permease [Parendozoicomonas haliclonae]|uniref:Hemin transport system permease protein HmuU n=1 Tax=Parendozoicomonas haliclonae TaxID=1960125 RepID=A0A1X7AIB8_9GAMM|nr:iron ABC transporter permease [Parendozoicomonas haliclonae]SMA44859.1 Hemin transport system permease protein HmuU [Parendozoicomonas haliclonae]
MERERKVRLFILGLAILLPVTMALSIVTGSVPVSLDNFIGLVQNWLGMDVANAEEQMQAWMVVEVIRLPRTLLGVIVGSTLAACGGAMQGLFRNPLADPSIIGVSSGAALGAGVGIVLTGMLPVVMVATLQVYTVPFLAFVGGFITTIAVYKIGTTNNGTSVATMLLAGIAIGALSGAGMGILNYVADDTMLRNLTFWQMGSLGGASWEQLVFIIPIMLALQVGLISHARGLNALLLGESEARHLGFHVQRLKIRLITMTALGVGVAVSISGMIGFVGLVVPHLVRMTIGPDHRYLMPASALLGGSLLLIADVLARIVVSPAELPIGIVTALLGAPFFMSLLWKQRGRIG